MLALDASSCRRAARSLHERVLENAWDSLARAMAELHAPHCASPPIGAAPVDSLPVDVVPIESFPTCEGCDRDSEELLGDAVWPCRTYTLLATTLLQVPDIEELLISQTHSSDSHRDADAAPGLGTEASLLSRQVERADLGSIR
jgi:hypothetical protein